MPTENLFVQLFAWLVIVFGVGYFWISRNPVTNVPIIKLGMLGKASVVLVCLAAVMMHTVSWQLLILASADLVYAVFFFGAQHDQKSGWRVIVSRRLALLTA